MQQRLLVIDDEEAHQLTTRTLLDGVCRVVSAYTLAEAEQELLKNDYDLILLDVSMPDGDGFSFYAKMRTMEHLAKIPVIFVTGKTETANEIMGFSLGAEDYVTKPVDPIRLKARVEARLSKLRDRKMQELTLCKGDIKLSISLQRASIVRDGRETEISLTPVEFKLLFHLLRYEEQVFSREQILTAIWDDAAGVFDRTVDMHVSKLRKKLTESQFQIKAVHGAGYKIFRPQ